MAIDPSGKPTTTGIMNSKPNIPQAPDLKNLGSMDKSTVAPQEPKVEQPSLQSGITPEGKQVLEKFPGVKNLTEDDMEALDAALSPSVKNALLKFLPELKPAFDILGSDEPNIIFPLSTVKRFAVQKYGGADEMEAVGNFVTEVLQLDAMQIDQQEGQQQTTVPPSQPQGIMTSPQNMEQV